MKTTVKDENAMPYEVELSSFGKEVVTFGRQPDNDIVVNSQIVSRIHGCFYKENGITYIEDMNSTNGLSFCGNKIKRRQLNIGDRIEICTGEGNAKVVFTCVSKSQDADNYAVPYNQMPYYSNQQPIYGQPTMGMNWFNFLIYFGLYAVGVVCIVSSLIYFLNQQRI